jgi:hypothetical protein
MTSKSFTCERTGSILVAASREAGLDRTGATLLRFGENAIYHLPNEQVVVRIGRSLVAAAKEVHVAGWLAEHEFPSARLVDDFDAGPMVVDDPPTQRHGPAVVPTCSPSTCSVISHRARKGYLP